MGKFDVIFQRLDFQVWCMVGIYKIIIISSLTNLKKRDSYSGKLGTYIRTRLVKFVALMRSSLLAEFDS